MVAVSTRGDRSGVAAGTRLDGALVAAATALNLGDGPLVEAFLSNRQAAYAQPATPGDWVATFDDMAVTQNQFPGPGRVIARQGRPGARIGPPYGAGSGEEEHRP